MKVILLKHVQGLGRVGDIKNISDGYARNFLLPRGMAELATKHKVKMSEQIRDKNKKDEMEKRRLVSDQARQLKEKVFEVQAKSDKKGSLYASLDAKEIAKAINKEKFSLCANDIKLKKKIKKTGKYDLDIKLGEETVKIKLVVLPSSE
jgi:large subunit ribosomal protein L9